jgi:predicted dehydrogenase
MAMHTDPTIGDGPREALSNRTNLDLVVICSPNQAHTQLALQATQAGLDLAIDKPVAISSREVRKVQSSH